MRTLRVASHVRTSELWRDKRMDTRASTNKWAHNNTQQTALHPSRASRFTPCNKAKEHYSTIKYLLVTTYPKAFEKNVVILLNCHIFCHGTVFAGFVYCSYVRLYARIPGNCAPARARIFLYFFFLWKWTLNFLQSFLFYVAADTSRIVVKKSSRCSC